MWSFLDGLRVEIDQFERYAKDLDRVLGQTNAMRLEEGIRHAS
jgi:hypothetical protein